MFVRCVNLLLGFVLCSHAAKSPRPVPSNRAYQDFAMRTDGDASRGRDIFASEQTSCARCHTADGSTARVGPDLSTIGDKFPRRELIRSILEPSSTIAIGYGSTIVETRTGDEIEGVIRQSTPATLELMCVDGNLRRIDTADIASQRNGTVSLMPEGLHASLSLEQFADLIAYLESLRLPASALAASRGAPDPIPPAAGFVRFDPFFGENIRFNHPVWMGRVPGSDNYLVLEHSGKSWLIRRRATDETQESFEDMSGVVRVGGATGLLGCAFHPKFFQNRKYYLKYQVIENGRISTLLVERQFTADGMRDAGVPARQLLKIDAVTQDHNGGCIEFGPDGFLYVGMGDTGPQSDPQGHGQDLSLLIGKILRIDVDRSKSGRPYAIPADNPFRAKLGARPEIWAYGFREPWRFTFDVLTGDLWVGDVGQDRIEEVSIVRSGENHGWNVYEGFTPFSTRYRRDDAQYIPPVMSYSHRHGVSITGGYVYRGKRASTLYGAYIFGDFESRRVWAITQTNRLLASAVEIGRAPTRIASFAQDTEGELLMVGYDSGRIYRLGLDSVDPTPMASQVLVQTSERTPVSWRYSLETPRSEWFRADFDDSSWTNSSGGFGTSGTPGAVVRTQWSTRDIWLRRDFLLTNSVPETAPIALRIHHDEDAEIYLNGVEAARVSRWTTGYTEIPVNAEAAKTLRPGRNIFAIHCRHNGGGQYIDAGIIRYVPIQR
jgi:putative heme-binding domain-containing protein